MRLIAVVLLALAALAPAAASAQEGPPLTDRAEGLAFFALFNGVWGGDGQSRTDSAAPFEVTRCEITSSLDPAAGTLTNWGPCANLQGNTTFEGALKLEAEGVLTGSFFSRVRGIEMVSSTGQLHTDFLQLDQHYRVRNGRVIEDVILRVLVGKPIDGAYRMIALSRNAETGEYIEVSNIVFRKIRD